MFKIHKPNHLTNLKYTASVIDVTMFAVKLSYKASVKKRLVSVDLLIKE